MYTQTHAHARAHTHTHTHTHTPNTQRKMTLIGLASMKLINT